MGAPKDYRFVTSCIEADGDDITEMKNGWESGVPPVEVTYETMLKHCDGMLDKAEELGYERKSSIGHGLTLKADWHVGYYKGLYQGRPCYFFQWSGIEYVWVKKGRR